jgi:NAD-dependent dihydropyrimidine dehydrogenase PreA subunit
MAYVIVDACAGCLDASCVEVCPCDCIEGPVGLAELARVPKGERGTRLPGVQLYIDPEPCIDCGACASVCPAQACFPEEEVPDSDPGARERNAAFFRR